VCSLVDLRRQKINEVKQLRDGFSGRIQQFLIQAFAKAAALYEGDKREWNTGLDRSFLDRLLSYKVGCGWSADHCSIASLRSLVG
jgi:hypothetical protein